MIRTGTEAPPSFFSLVTRFSVTGHPYYAEIMSDGSDSLIFSVSAQFFSLIAKKKLCKEDQS